MVPVVHIGRDDEHLDLVLEPDHRMSVVLVGRGLQASHLMEPSYADNGFGDLVEYFTDLERSWRGWQGARSWRSLEDELSIDATHTGSHVVLSIELHNGPLASGAVWTARLELALEAGEELTSAAAGIRTLARTA